LDKKKEEEEIKGGKEICQEGDEKETRWR